MPTANQTCPSGFDHYSSCMYDHSHVNESPDKNSYNNCRDWYTKFPYETPLSSTSSSPNQQKYASAILNLTGKENLGMNLDSNVLESPIGNMRTSLSPQSEDIRNSKLMLDLSRIKSSVSSLFSDSSISTGSSNSDMSFFPNSIQTCRSDSPNSETSSHSAESVSTHTNGTLPQLTEQEFANLQNLHVINCMSNMSKEQFMQTINVLHSVLQYQSAPIVENDALELQAKYHRSAAGNAEAQFTWSGKLPKRSFKRGPYSSKVFLGGVPWDITEEMLICSFHQFGNVKVEWPGKDSIAQPKGYAYIIFENEMQVKLLLESCREGVDENEGSFYYKIPTSRRTRPKEVQVIPWSINDSNYSVKTFQKLDPLKTIFVGALHGMMNAEGLFRVMNDLFGGVLYAGIDTDKNKYPIGSGRVTFIDYKNYVKAVTAAFVDIKTPRFNKKVQLDPYLEETPCSLCHIQLGPYFCRENGCFRYFCTNCWSLHHTSLKSHKPLMRNSKHGGLMNAITVPH
ncbi:hypothetical protein V9T40_012897 [Parthenolecanium corni]|uniref:RRM domain-containing protein n=1 Tax=Parthenolecanium corni TaxID=536013 RepID=A0AAN9T9S3_9HEMI